MPIQITNLHTYNIQGTEGFCMTEHFNSRFDKLDNKLESLDKRLDNVDITLARQNITLEEHVRRCNLLESEVKPMKALVLQIVGVGKFIGLIGVVASIVMTILKLKS